MAIDAQDPATGLSFSLSKAVAAGREHKGKPDNRETVLARLLVKRAAAHRAGLAELEQIMRGQIRWALPIMQDSQSDEDNLAA